MRLLGWAVFAWGFVGCGARSGLQFCEPVGESGPGIFEPPPDGGTFSSYVSVETIQDVDLLVMVDDSPSMREEQQNLAANLGDLVLALTQAEPRVENLHVGVISSDMGTGGSPVSGCNASDFGDDGILQHAPSPDVVGCRATYPPFLTFDASRPNDEFGQDFECIGMLGTAGCGFEQQLAAVTKALTVHAVPRGANDEFLRGNSLLAILLMSDENDCSVADLRFFGEDESLGPLNLRCFNNEGMLRPVGELVDGILSARPNHPERVVVAGIVGVPPDLVALTEAELAGKDLQSAQDFERILHDARMIETVDFSPAGGGNRIVPACEVPGLGIAFPARRIVELIRDVDAAGGNGAVQSICQADWSPVMAAIKRLIQQRLVAQCGSLPACAGDSPPDCVLYEAIPAEDDCAEGGMLDLGTTGGQRICEICRLGDDGRRHDARGRNVSCCSSDEGWSLDTASEICDEGELVFTRGARPADGAPLYIECPCGEDSSSS